MTSLKLCYPEVFTLLQITCIYLFKKMCRKCNKWKYQFFRLFQKHNIVEKYIVRTENNASVILVHYRAQPMSTFTHTKDHLQECHRGLAFKA